MILFQPGLDWALSWRRVEEVFRRWDELGFIDLGVWEPKRSQVWCPGSWRGQLEGGSAILRGNTTRSTGVFEGDKESRSKVHIISLSLPLGDWQKAQERIPTLTPTSRSPATCFRESDNSCCSPSGLPRPPSAPEAWGNVSLPLSPSSSPLYQIHWGDSHSAKGFDQPEGRI